MRVLELFKGTGSVGKVIRSNYPEAEIISLDILTKYQPTICCDILEWNYQQYPRGHFDLIWGSPECKVYSALQYTNIGRKWANRDELDAVREEHSKYVKKVLEIIEYFDPKRWYIENPYYSAMKDLECMKSIPSFRFDYCRFGYDYKKPTRIWTNRIDLANTICTCSGSHKYQLGITTTQKMRKGQIPNQADINQKYSIPQKLMELLLVEAMPTPH
jgi:hypothetical protein